MVRIRLTRIGRRNLAKWRVGVFDAHTRRDGRPIEYLGNYDPHATDDVNKVRVNVERAKYWIEKGAQPTRTVRSLLRIAGLDL